MKNISEDFIVNAFCGLSAKEQVAKLELDSFEKLFESMGLDFDGVYYTHASSIFGFMQKEAQKLGFDLMYKADNTVITTFAKMCDVVMFFKQLRFTIELVKKTPILLKQLGACPEKEKADDAKMILQDEGFWDWVDLNFTRLMGRWEHCMMPEKGNWSTEELYRKYKEQGMEEHSCIELNEIILIARAIKEENKASERLKSQCDRIEYLAQKIIANGTKQ